MSLSFDEFRETVTDTLLQTFNLEGRISTIMLGIGEFDALPSMFVLHNIEKQTPERQREILVSQVNKYQLIHTVISLNLYGVNSSLDDAIKDLTSNGFPSSKEQMMIRPDAQHQLLLHFATVEAPHQRNYVYPVNILPADRHLISRQEEPDMTLLLAGIEPYENLYYRG